MASRKRVIGETARTEPPAGPQSGDDLSRLPDQNPHPVLICRGPGNLTYGNPAAAGLVSELGLRSARDLLPPDHRRIKRACLDTGRPVTAEVEVAGRVITWSYRPVREASVVHLYGVEITPRRPAENAGADAPAFGSILDQLAAGVVLVDRDLRVCFKNRSAAAVLSAGDGLSLRDGRLAGAVHPLTRRLRQMVESAIDRAGDHPSVLSVPRPGGHATVDVLVSPTAGAHGAGAGTAIVFLFDSEIRTNRTVQILMGLYGLTGAEAHLVGLLLDGASLTDAADALHVTRGTARNRLQEVYRKTGTHRQAELVKRIQGGPAGMLAGAKL